MSTQGHTKTGGLSAFLTASPNPPFFPPLVENQKVSAKNAVGANATRHFITSYFPQRFA